jgi:hypothetical protein
MRIKNYWLLTVLAAFILPVTALSQSDTIVAKFILVGDAGELANGHHPVMDGISRLSKTEKKATAIFFLGDNVYPLGLPNENTAAFDSKKKLLDLQWKEGLNAASQIVFIPGNHDWAKGRSYGWQQVRRESDYINGLGDSSIRFLPSDACPGPEEILFGPFVTAVVIDSQWWLQQDGRPGVTSDCDCKTEEEVLLRLKDIVYRNRNKLLLFLSHHPFISDGVHGGYFTFKQHIFPLTDINPSLYIPLPVIGSLYPLIRGGFGNIQDLRHPLYKNMSASIDSILSKHPNCIRIAGHEHGLQFLEKNGQQYIVSGAGSKKTRLKNGPYTKFNAVHTGYATLELWESGKIGLQFEGSEIDSTTKLFTTALPSLKKVQDTAILVQRPVFPDSISIIPASYYNAGSFKQWLLGKNYRTEWTTSIKVPVLDIGKANGGLTPTKRGGGMQSRSLRLEDPSGKEFALRSIEKYPDKTLPEELRQTFIKDAVVDGISASYPYAALSVPPFAMAADVPYLSSRLVYLPDDPLLLQYKNDFGNGLYLFEEREPEGIKKTYSSAKVVEQLEKDNDNSIDQKEVLKARLLDMYLMDFDRHEDQWRWGSRPTRDGKKFYPIPRDRDQAFFTNDGLIPSLISKPWLQPKFQGFRAKAKNINTFNFNARYFDRNFLNEPDAKDWQAAIDRFIPEMTDSVIKLAMQQQPNEIQNQHAVSIASILKARRQWFQQDAMKYYRFLSSTIDVAGSNKRELFDLEWKDDGTINLRVFKINKEGKRSDKQFERTINPSETKEIRLYGLNGDDVFQLHGTGLARTRIRIIGGNGKDSLLTEKKNLPANKVKWYDNSSEGNVKLGEGRYKNMFSKYTAVNEFNRRNFRYNILMPLVSAAYNPDDGIYLGAGIKSIRQGFRKNPFKITQQFLASYAIATGAYNFKYELEAIDLIKIPFTDSKKLDLQLFANFKAPDNIQNFFGFGNETEFPNEGKQTISYYRSRFDLVELAALVRSKPLPSVSLLTGPVFQHYSIDKEKNLGKFITEPASGLNQEDLYDQKTYLGWQIQAIIDNRNNKHIPSRGIYWNSLVRWVNGQSSKAYSFAQYKTDLSFYTSFNSRANFVIAVRIGAGANSGRYEFFQAQNLGGTENLRGFRKFRFAGDRMVFNNIDLRIRLGEIKGYILPATTGIILFHDIGRVWIPEENSGRWHNGYGAGIWLAPAGRIVVTGFYAYSKDGGLPTVSLGFQF